MNSTARLALAASATFAFATLGAVAPAQAVTQHCPVPTGAVKYEVNAGTTYDTDLPAGTTVCIKAGTQIDTVTVGEGGLITSTIRHRNGQLLGISYYVAVPPSSSIS